MVLIPNTRAFSSQEKVQPSKPLQHNHRAVRGDAGLPGRQVRSLSHAWPTSPRMVRGPWPRLLPWSKVLRRLCARHSLH